MLQLRRQVVLSTSLILLVSLGLVFFAALQILEQLLLREKVAQTRILVSLVESVTDNPTLTPSERAREFQNLLVTGTRSGVSYLTVINTRGELVFSGGAPLASGSVPRGTAGLSKGSSLPGGVLWEQQENGLLAVFPRQARAFTELHLSTAPEKVWLEKAGTLLALYMVVEALLLLALAVLYWDRKVVQPVSGMMRTAERVAAGTNTWTVAPPAGGELDRLSTSLGTMVGKLQQDNELLQAQAHALRNTQDQLIQSEKLAVVGQLAAGVAHEIGNPLSTIMMNLELFGKTEWPERDLRRLQLIQNEAARMRTIIQGLLDYSRPPLIIPEATTLQTVVTLTLDLLKAQPRFKNIEITQNWTPDSPPVKAQPAQLQQVLINLLLNAADAITEAKRPAGRITLSTLLVQRERKAMLGLTIHDNGTGMSAETSRRIFDPFFTTKPPGQGTGLGLSVSRQIVESLGGTLEVASLPLEGTAFTLWLEVWPA